MGLINELNAINRTLENSQKQLTKTEQKEQEREKQKELEKLLKNQFSELFYNIDNENDLQLLTKNLIKNKTKNIIIIKENYESQKGEKLNENNIDFIEKIYIEIMNESKKDIENILKIEKNEQKEREKLQKEVEKLKSAKYKMIENQLKEEERKRKEIQKITIFEQEEEAKRRTQKAIQKQMTYNAIITILKYIIVLLATPFIIIAAFVYGILKSTK